VVGQDGSRKQLVGDVMGPALFEFKNEMPRTAHLPAPQMQFVLDAANEFWSARRVTPADKLRRTAAAK